MDRATEWVQRGTAWTAAASEGAEVPDEITLPDGMRLKASPGDEDWVGYGFEAPDGHRWLLSSSADAGNGCEWVLEPAQDLSAE